MLAQIAKTKLLYKCLFGELSGDGQADGQTGVSVGLVGSDGLLTPNGPRGFYPRGLITAVCRVD